jgi:hypothetical protein
MIYNKIGDVDNGDDAGSPRNPKYDSQGQGIHLFSEPHLRLGKLVEGTTEAHLT